MIASDGTRIEDIPFGEDGETERYVVSCSIVDPYVLVLMNGGSVMLFMVDCHTRDLRMCQELKVCLYHNYT